jgi:nucleoside-diphosphate-sugar epimerase
MPATTRGFWKAKKCLVVGGGGNLGSYCVQALLDRDVGEVATYDLVAFPAIAGREGEVESVIGDVLDTAALGK